MAAAGLLDTMKRAIAPIAALLAVALSVPPAQAQNVEPKAPPEARLVVVGEGRVTVAPDYARIRTGVSTNAKTAKEASDANAKLMAGVIAALVDAGIAKKDIQTAQFSIDPVYTSPSSAPSSGERKLSGFRVSNQVNVTIHEIGQVGDILDRLVRAGATEASSIAFLNSDPEKALDQAREAAIANARHKAELYARASDLNLGRVAWITESADFQPVVPMAVNMQRMSAPAKPVPIETGEETITARVTVGFEVAQ
jgi:uncharacterized protein YggE